MFPITFCPWWPLKLLVAPLPKVSPLHSGAFSVPCVQPCPSRSCDFCVYIDPCDFCESSASNDPCDSFANLCHPVTPEHAMSFNVAGASCAIQWTQCTLWPQYITEHLVTSCDSCACWTPLCRDAYVSTQPQALSCNSLMAWVIHAAF